MDENVHESGYYWGMDLKVEGVVLEVEVRKIHLLLYMVGRIPRWTPGFMASGVLTTFYFFNPTANYVLL